MKYGLYDITYDPDAEDTADRHDWEAMRVLRDDDVGKSTPWVECSCACVWIINTLATQRDDCEDIGLRALEKLAARITPSHAVKLAQAVRVELSQAYLWILTTQGARSRTGRENMRISDHPQGKQHGFDRAMQVIHAPVDGVALANAAIAKRFEQTGDTGKAFAADLREGNRDRVQKYRDGTMQAADVFCSWVPDESGEPPVLFYLAQALWHDRLKRTKALEMNSYTKTSKLAGAFLGWAPGAPAIELDASRFCLTANAPARVFGPRSLPLLPDSLDLERSHNATLPLDYRRSDDTEAQLALALVDPTQVAIDLAGSKIALLALGNPHVLSGGIGAITAKDLAITIHAGQPYRGRMLGTTVAGLSGLRRLMVYMPDGTRSQMFSIRDVADPKDVKPEMELGLALDRHFHEAAWAAFKGRGSTWSGSFVLDITGAMAIPMNRPELLRLHVRASVRANAAFCYSTGAFDREKLNFESLTEIAARINAIDAQAAELLAANGKLPRSTKWIRVKASEQRRKVRENMEDLEGRGLWTVDKQGRDQCHSVKK